MTGELLVTGAYGFIGRHAARRWSRDGWRVRGLGHGIWSREESRGWGVDEWHAADVSLDALVTYGGEPDLILHCAGSASVAFSVLHPYQDFQRSTRTTAAVLEYARVHAPQARVVLLSTAAVYGDARVQPIPETAAIAPVSPYGVHKRLAEELCQSFAGRYGLRAAVVRFFSVYGAGLRKQLLWDACSKLSRGDATFGGSGDERRDWLHVSDAVELLGYAAERASPECPIVNGGSGTSIRVRDLLSRIAGEFAGAGRVNFSGSARTGDPDCYEADIGTARSWGWRTKVDLDTGVSEYVDWYKAGAA